MVPWMGAMHSASHTTNAEGANATLLGEDGRAGQDTGIFSVPTDHERIEKTGILHS